MPIITITSDWNREDFYLAVLKGRILKDYPEATVVDVSHNIQSFNIGQAAFILRNSYPHFPAGTIHIIAVNSEVESGKHYLAVAYQDQYFLASDSGVFGLLCREDPAKIIALETPGEATSFIGLDVFARAACRLAKGERMEQLGKAVRDYQKSTPMRAVIDDKVINGSVIHIDSFKNAITNISQDLFNRVGKGKKFEIFIHSNHYKISKINHFYHESPPGELLALFNSCGLLEIAINRGNAADLLSLQVNSNVRVKFKD